MSTAIATPTTRAWLNKVPAITATFWVIKILSTTIGETFADYLTVNVGLGQQVTDLVMLGVLAVALTLQFRTRQVTPVIYWFTVVCVSIVGTQITDFLTDTLGISLWVSTGVFSVILALVFTLWYREERTLAITSINTPRREAFYWGAILTTFALGTAAGDLATEALGLGFRNGALIFGGLILACWVARKAGASLVLTFWVAYILTRPLGASIGDLLTQERSLGGFGLGAQLTSLIFFAVIVVLVVREQWLVNQYGVAEKGSGPHGGRARDFSWAALAAAAVVGATAVAAPTASVAASASAAQGPLGDLTSYSTIVNDLGTKVKAGDLAGATTRVKDLEVAWDSSEAGLKPKSPHDWHTMDVAIDGVLTSLRAPTPTQADSAHSIATLQHVIASLQHR
ncbi:COG4705 family protein [Kribbia dieselivorans]|uniref:COG4705 family protein n=1 Tax=Kribbia dieselivorans TaxID=331526 RepID=UPI0008383B16|nr:hypothetical protein [Kribbia dieselivorans]